MFNYLNKITLNDYRNPYIINDKIYMIHTLLVRAGSFCEFIFPALWLCHEPVMNRMALTIILRLL